MMHVLNNASHLRLNRTLSRSLVIGALSAIGLLSGLAPNFGGQFPLVVSTAAHAQSVSEREMTGYAKAVLDIEDIRNQFYNDAKRIVGSGNVPKFLCTDEGSVRSIGNANVREIAVKYCNQSKAVIDKYEKDYGLNITRFNEITMGVRNNAELKKRVQSELVREQQRRAGQ